MIIAFLLYVLIFMVVSIGEFGTLLHYKNMTCYRPESNNTNDTLDQNFNTTNLTDILNEKEDEKFWGVVDTNILNPKIWLGLSALVGIVMVFCILFVLTIKKRGNDKTIIFKVISGIIVLMVVCRLILLAYSFFTWTHPDKTCTKVLFDLQFNEMLYITYGTTVIEIIYVFSLLSYPPDEKAKKMHDEIEKEKKMHKEMEVPILKFSNKNSKELNNRDNDIDML
jgi:formate-dependent nitrite reductase membrane component NrfD